MNWKRIIFVGLGVAALALPVGCAAAHSHRCQNPAKIAKFITWKVNDTLDDVKATDAQRARVLAVKDRLLAAGLKLHAGNASFHEQFEREWRSDRIDVQQMRSLADQRLTELRSVIYQGIDGLAEVHATLTPTQRAQLADEFKKVHGP